MGTNSVKQDQIYTYENYLTWPDEERWELIAGTAYAMTAPSRQHQQILGNLFLEFGNYLKGKQCEVYAAPFDVRLPHKNETAKNSTTVVQPDITVVCNRDKLDAKGCCGSPDLIIEILSPATASHDMIRKRRVYELNGVKEYWIVDPAHSIVTQFLLAGGEYGKMEFFDRESEISPAIFPDLIIRLKEIFPPLADE